jgi:hypothetical protein
MVQLGFELCFGLRQRPHLDLGRPQRLLQILVQPTTAASTASTSAEPNTAAPDAKLKREAGLLHRVRGWAAGDHHGRAAPTPEAALQQKRELGVSKGNELGLVVQGFHYIPQR